jgi:ribosome maturation factor RimP
VGCAAKVVDHSLLCSVLLPESPGLVLEVRPMDIKAIVEDVLSPLGYELLELSHSTGRTTGTILVRIDRLDEAPVTTEDLERASRGLGLEFDRLDAEHNMFPQAYKLDVESPGPKRPLTRLRHFERMNGLKIKVKQRGGSFFATITKVMADGIVLTDEQGELKTVSLDDIQHKTVTAYLAEWPDSHR